MPPARSSISISAEESTVTTLIGANGAGKTTCLRAISGLVGLSSGEIWFADERIDGLPPQKIVSLGIGHVPEGKRLFLEMTILDNLMTGAYLRRDREKVHKDLDRIYEYFPILKAASNRQASNLSGGEQQMLATTRALMTTPRLLLMDEPSMGLSPILVEEVGKIIQDINHDGISIILVEQNARMALNTAHYCYVLEVGNITRQGTGKDLSSNEDVKKAYMGG